MPANRQYKDRLFKFIFGNPDNKEWTRSLYNAVNGSCYTNPDDIQLTTIENAVYMSMRNDVSFLIADTMNLYEQQASFNPNMPMRFLIYAGMMYGRYVEENRSYHRYSSRQQKAPTPKCICFYNGKEDREDRVILRLSDAFDTDVPPDIEVTVTMININYGHNRELLESCRPLGDYAKFVELVRASRRTAVTLEQAIDAAINELDSDSTLKAFLTAHKAEVKFMCITEYDEERTIAEFREEGKEEGRAEGRAEGLEEGRVEAMRKMMKELSFSAEQAMNVLGIPDSDRKRYTESLKV